MEPRSMAYEHARALLEQGRRDLAIPRLRQAIAEAPEDARPRVDLADSLVVLYGATEEAISEAREAVAADPNWSLSHRVLARCLHKAGRLVEAEAAIREAIRLEPDRADNFSILSFVLSDRGRNDLALAAIREGLVRNPVLHPLRRLEVFYLYQLNLDAEAKRGLQGILELCPEDDFTQDLRGWIAVREGRLEEAEAAFREAMRINVCDPWAGEGLVYLESLRSPIRRLLRPITRRLEKASGGDRLVLLIAPVICLAVAIWALSGRTGDLGPMLSDAPAWIRVGTIVLVAAPLVVAAILWIAEPLAIRRASRDPSIAAQLRPSEIRAARRIGPGLTVAAAGVLLAVFGLPIDDRLVRLGVGTAACGLSLLLIVAASLRGRGTSPIAMRMASFVAFTFALMAPMGSLVGWPELFASAGIPIGIALVMNWCLSFVRVLQGRP